MKIKSIVQSVMWGFGVGVLYLLTGTVLDYLITQVVSQFFLTDCSEDCYFSIFNFIFVVVAVLSVAGGLLRGMSVYRRLAGE
jgi:hypothetical protein